MFFQLKQIVAEQFGFEVRLFLPEKYGWKDNQELNTQLFEH